MRTRSKADAGVPPGKDDSQAAKVPAGCVVRIRAGSSVGMKERCRVYNLAFGSV